MRKLTIGLMAFAIIGLAVVSERYDAQAANAAVDWTKITPLEALDRYPELGTLENPYNDKIDEIADSGKGFFNSAGCTGCHGGGGGGGMCPAVTNNIWSFGPEDDHLFRLVTLGTQGLKDKYPDLKRTGGENNGREMPAQGPNIQTADELWRIIAWIRKVNPESMKKGEEVPPPPVFD